jgi:hypothetical protein
MVSMQANKIACSFDEIDDNYDAGLPALYMCVTVPLGFLLNGEWHYGSEEMSV